MIGLLMVMKSYEKDGAIVARKRKYCSKSLLEYLKANTAKYNLNNFKNKKNKQQQNTYDKEAELTSSTTFKVESYASQDEK